MSAKYIDPLSDFGFKHLFGRERNKAILINLLNAILPEENHIKELNYVNTEQIGEFINDRKAVYDLRCISKNGTQFIVEVQRVKQRYFKDRSLFYASRLISHIAHQGDWDFKLNPLFTIGILDFELDKTKQTDKLFHTVTLKDDEGELFYDKLHFIYLEVSKFNKTEKELNSILEHWLFLLKNLPSMDAIPYQFTSEYFAQLFQEAEVALMESGDRFAYDQEIKRLRDLHNTTKYALDEARAEGKAKGLKEGRKLGKEQGREEGREQGREEGEKEKALRIAKNMKEEGFPLELISRLTGLDIAKIEAL